MGLDLDGDGKMDQLMQGPLGVDVDNDGSIDVVITPEQLRAFLVTQGVPEEKLPLIPRPSNEEGNIGPDEGKQIKEEPPMPPVSRVGRTQQATEGAVIPPIDPVWPSGNLPFTHRPPPSMYLGPTSPYSIPPPAANLSLDPRLSRPMGTLHMPVKIHMRKLAQAEQDTAFPYHNPVPDMGCQFMGHVLPATSRTIWLEFGD